MYLATRKNSGGGVILFLIYNESFQDMRELGIPTKNTNPIHKDVPENIFIS
jgi:hypothetical protein